MGTDVRTRSPAGLASAAAVAAVLSLSAATSAWAHRPPHRLPKGHGVTERQLRAAESVALGPEHAAEHAAERRALRRWARRPLAARRRVTRETKAAARTFATSTAAATSDTDIGTWTQAGYLPQQAINAVLMPTGKVLFWGRAPRKVGGGATDRENYSNAYIWDPAHPDAEPKDVTPIFDVTDDGMNNPDRVPLFCSGQSLLPDGEVFAAGGTLAYPDPKTGLDYKGAFFAFTFDPWTETWTRQPDMHHGRWYPGQVELPDGRIAVMAGSDETGGGVAAMNTELEVFTPAAQPGGVGHWDSYPAGTRLTGYYPHMFTLPSGRVMLAGPDPEDSAWLDPGSFGGSGAGSAWTSLSEMNTWHAAGSAVLMPGGASGSTHVGIAGGNLSRHDGTTDQYALTTAESIDADAANPQWTFRDGPLAAPDANRLPGLNVPRANFNMVLLPDGSIVTVGGAAGIHGDPGQNWMGDPPDPRLKQVELYRPGLDTAWRLGPAEVKWRGYHSTALLLPDGRVWSAGDDYWAPDGSPDPYHSADRAEIYTPPYLYTAEGAAAARPAITSAPQQVRWNTAFRVSTTGSVPARAVLVAPGAVTHANDMNQRNLALRIARSAAGTTDLVSPPDRDVAPPGWYMLFVLDADGTPSVAQWIQLTASAPDTTPPGGATPTSTPTPTSSPAPTPTLTPTPTPTATPTTTRAPIAKSPPRARVTVRASRHGSTARVRVTLSQKGRIRARVRGGRREVRKTLRYARAGTQTIRFRLRPHRVARLKITLAVTDRAGRTSVHDYRRTLRAKAS
jgi:Domain of unknown function (DUF1929)